jgi:hypothetical protein
MPHRLTSGKGLVGAIAIGRGGGALSFCKKYTAVSINPASIAATSRGIATATCAGAAVGDFVIALAPTGLNVGLAFVGARVSSADTIEISLWNGTAGAIDDTARAWDFLILRAI